ncbi:DUF4326 domain-containing protein [Streptomyces sp. NPDC020800]|uniref:DUF4326 domain-containing protein n=1 Tax=Streptomyces sp. NPDC020800 TaxID=3365092 RepID=UPI0037AB7CEC
MAIRAGAGSHQPMGRSDASEVTPRRVELFCKVLLLRGWDLPRHPLYNPFAYDTPKKNRYSTRAEVKAMYRARLLEHPELLDLVPDLRGKTLACWCTPEPCHADVLAELADAGDVTRLS